MATYTFYPSSTNSAYASCFDTGGSYTKARQGTGSIGIGTGNTAAAVGQLRAGSLYQCLESLYEFDTSSLAGKTITSATLSVYVTGRQNDVSYTVEARLYDWGNTVENADYLAGSSMGAKTLLATLADTAATAGAYRAFSDVALPANVNKTGKTRIGLFNSNQRLNNAPGNGVDEYINIDAEAGTNPPKLVVVTADEGSAVITAANATLSSTVSIETHGDANITTDDASVAATAELIGTASGVLNVIAADATLSSTVGIETFAYIEITLDDASLSTTALVAKEGAADVTEADATVEAIAAWNFTGAAVITAADATLATSTRAGIEGQIGITLADAVLTAAESAPPWPFIYDFPQTPLDGTWRPELGDDTLRSDRDVGARQRRMRNGGNYAFASFAIMLVNDNQRLELDRFYASECKHGTVPFTWEDPETGDIERWTWAAAPAYSHVARDNYRVECALRKEAA